MGWLIALGVLGLLAVLPLGASVIYDEDGVLARLVVGPLKITLFPRPRKDKKPKKNKKKSKSEKQTDQKKEASGAEHQEAPKQKKSGGPITDFLPLVKVLLQFLDGFRRKLRVNVLELKLIMAGDDPCDLAVNYGRAWAAVGNLMPQLERLFVIRKRDIQVECDFASAETTVVVHLDISITLGRLLALVIFYGIRILFELLSMKRKGGGNK